MSLDQPFIWKGSLGGSINLVGQSLWGSPRWIKLCCRLIESQIWHQTASSVGKGFSKETMASAHPDARHSSFSLYASGAFQALTLVLELRGSESE